MEYTKEQHTYLEFLRLKLQSFQKEWQDVVPLTVSGRIATESKYLFRSGDSVRKAANDTEDFMRGFEGGNLTFDALTSYLDGLGDNIKTIRSGRKSGRSYSPLKEAKYKSKAEAERVLSNAFPRSHASLDISKDVGVACQDHQNKWNVRNYVNVGVTWWRSVGRRGFGMVNAPSGLLFITSCKYRDVKYVTEENMNAWEVTGVSMKSGRGQNVSGWLVTHKSTDHNDDTPLVSYHDRVTRIPHAFGKNLSRAHSLMQQRTMRHLVKQLGE